MRSIETSASFLVQDFPVMFAKTVVYLWNPNHSNFWREKYGINWNKSILGFTVGDISVYFITSYNNSHSFASDVQTKIRGVCKPGQKQVGSQCVCMSPEEDCG